MCSNYHVLNKACEKNAASSSTPLAPVSVAAENTMPAHGFISAVCIAIAGKKSVKNKAANQSAEGTGRML
jgi:hypothetical protein